MGKQSIQNKAGRMEGVKKQEEETKHENKTGD